MHFKFGKELLRCGGHLRSKEGLRESRSCPTVTETVPGTETYFSFVLCVPVNCSIIFQLLKSVLYDLIKTSN